MLISTALFRCDASPDIGSGHIIRCLTLANALSEKGWKCVFAVTPKTLETVPALKKAGYEIVDTDTKRNVDLLIVDHYSLDHIYESTSRSWAQHILVIDDLADRAHNCDFLLDQTYGRCADDYTGLVPADCAIFTGADYALLKPAFAKIRKKTLIRRTQKNGVFDRVLISMGATNVRNVTGKVLTALAAWNEQKLVIDVILGAHAYEAGSVKALVMDISRTGPHEVNYLTNVSDMASLMAHADLAIGAGGTTSWERCCLGLPAIMLEIADNQSVIAKNLHDAGAVINLGKDSDFSEAALAETLSRLKAQPEKMLKMTKKASRICDGSGIDRICKEIHDAGF